MEDNEEANGTDTGADEFSVRADELSTCANCGSQIDTTKWHPLVTQTDDDDTFQVYAFCDEDCRENWAENYPQQTS